jgi:hypothetical protein
MYSWRDLGTIAEIAWQYDLEPDLDVLLNRLLAAAKKL